uniref:Uncharacterized protein LOC103963003 isoform X1 n=1 Tax=Rhizophora mucronata TaxID=61149 RepID=A0A2P2M7J3_RHIMU
MATTQLFLQILRPIPAISVASRRVIRTLRAGNADAIRQNMNFKWALRLSLVEQSLPAEESTGFNVKQLVDFLYDDLPHLFDDQGIDRTAYDEYVKFRDPITKHDSISGYLFNIALLKVIFRPQFLLHWVKQTGPYEITTRWTMVMTFMLLPWRPELVFTGTSVMGINPKTRRFCSHLDLWDSIKNNDYFSVEGLWDVLKQVRLEILQLDLHRRPLRVKIHM